MKPNYCIHLCSRNNSNIFEICWAEGRLSEVRSVIFSWLDLLFAYGPILQEFLWPKSLFSYIFAVLPVRSVSNTIIAFLFLYFSFFALLKYWFLSPTLRHKLLSHVIFWPRKLSFSGQLLALVKLPIFILFTYNFGILGLKSKSL